MTQTPKIGDTVYSLKHNFMTDSYSIETDTIIDVVKTFSRDSEGNETEISSGLKLANSKFYSPTYHYLTKQGAIDATVGYLEGDLKYYESVIVENNKEIERVNRELRDLKALVAE